MLNCWKVSSPLRHSLALLTSRTKPVRLPTQALMVLVDAVLVPTVCAVIGSVTADRNMALNAAGRMGENLVSFCLLAEPT